MEITNKTSKFETGKDRWWGKWDGIELENWETYLKENYWDHGKGFYDYLQDQGAWVVNGKYKEGAVGDSAKYEELIWKWNMLQDHRYKRDGTSDEVLDKFNKRKTELFEIKKPLSS